MLFVLLAYIQNKHTTTCISVLFTTVYVNEHEGGWKVSKSVTVLSVLQGVHVGNMTAETEEDSKRSDKTDGQQDAYSVQQQKSNSPVKHTDGQRKKAEHHSRPRVKPTGWTCGECLQWFPERESYVSHVKTIHGKVGDQKHVITAVHSNASLFIS